MDRGVRAQNRQKQFIIDGEAVILGVDGVSDFNALHSRKQDEEVQLYAFDILALDGEDLRQLPLSMRKTNLARLLARRPDGSSSHPSSREMAQTCFGSLQHGPRGAGVEASRPSLSSWVKSRTGSRSRTEASRNGARDGILRVNHIRPPRRHV